MARDWRWARASALGSVSVVVKEVYMAGRGVVSDPVYRGRHWRWGRPRSWVGSPLSVGEWGESGLLNAPRNRLPTIDTATIWRAGTAFVVISVQVTIGTFPIRHICTKPPTPYVRLSATAVLVADSSTLRRTEVSTRQGERVGQKERARRLMRVEAKRRYGVGVTTDMTYFPFRPERQREVTPSYARASGVCVWSRAYDW